MNPNREETLFFAATEMATPEERAAYLERECAGDAALRQRVEALLAKSLKADAFFGEELKSEAEGPGGTVLVPVTERAGDTIGRYKLLQQIGEGGCGVVYMAEQSEPVKRRVALKVIKLGMDTKQVVARFEAERQALALMDHPNIAKVLDGGATSTGRPFFVMELVRGTKITEFCDQQKLSTEERLDLFLQVCAAIQHAHQKGIIHRDIKPSNVLVTMVDGKPVPKVIDFGIAKATTGQELTDKTLFTAFEQFIGTPAYMSPEQAEMSGVDIDTRSDIYSLGVLLYELLTGRTPFDATELIRSGIDGIRKTLKEQEPPKPSTKLNTLADVDLTTVANARQVEPPKLLHSVRGDLDWVVMKCLEKDRARRYETANGIAADLRRHLGNEPIVARPPSVGYLLQKAYRRNKLVFAAATAVALALLIGIVASTWQAVRAKRAEKNARDEAARATKAETIAMEREAETRKALARSALSLAEAALREGDGFAIQAALADVPETLRDSTWRYLFDQSDSSFARLHPGTRIFEVVAHPKLPSVFGFVDQKGLVCFENIRSGERLLEFNPEILRGDGRLAISPDGENVAVSTRQPESGIAIHSTRNGKRVMSIAGEGSKLLRYSPDGKWLIQATPEPVPGTGKLNLWNAATGEVVWTVPSPGRVLSIDFTPDGDSILIHAGSYPTVIDRKTGAGIDKIASNYGNNGALSQDGKLHINATKNGTVQGSSFTDKGFLYKFRTDDRLIEHIRFGASGERFVTIATASSGRQIIRVWDAKTGSYLHSLLGGQGKPASAVVHPLSGELVVGGADTRAWRLDRPLWSRRNPHQIYTISCTAFVGDDDTFIGPGRHSQASLHRGVRELWSSPWPYRSAATSRGGDFLCFGVIGGGRNQVLMVSWDGNQVKDQRKFVADKGSKKLSPSPNGKYLAFNAGEENAIFQVWDTAANAELNKLQVKGMVAFNDLAWLDDHRLLGLVTMNARRGSSGTAERIVVWDVTSGEIVRSASADTTMDVLAAAPDGLRFAEAGTDKVVRIRRADTLEIEKTFRVHDGPVTALAWHPGRDIVATGSSDLTVRVWDLSSGKRIEEFRGPLAAPHTLAFSPAGIRLSCASQDGYVRLWDLDSSRKSSSRTGVSDAERNRYDKDPKNATRPAQTAAGFWKASGSQGWLKALRASGVGVKSANQVADGTWNVNLARAAITNLAILKGAPISILKLEGTAISDLTPLRGMALKTLWIQDTKVIDISPLKGMSLEILRLHGTPVSDLSPLRSMPLVDLRLHGCEQITDLTPLADRKELQKLTLPPHAKDIEFLRTFPKLERIGFDDAPKNGTIPAQTTAEFWKEYDAKKQAEHKQQ